ncbi:hypothetical protein [Paraburkholderia sp. GAS42]
MLTVSSGGTIAFTAPQVLAARASSAIALNLQLADEAVRVIDAHR